MTTNKKNLEPKSLQRRALWTQEGLHTFSIQQGALRKLVAHCNSPSKEATSFLRLPELHSLVKYLSSSQAKKEQKDFLFYFIFFCVCVYRSLTVAGWLGEICQKITTSTASQDKMRARGLLVQETKPAPYVHRVARTWHHFTSPFMD